MTGFVGEQEEELARGNQAKFPSRDFFDRRRILSQAAGLLPKSRIVAPKAGDVINKQAVSALGLQCVHETVFPYESVRDKYRCTQQKCKLYQSVNSCGWSAWSRPRRGALSWTVTRHEYFTSFGMRDAND